MVTYPIEGACQCGGATYQLLAEPLIVPACHSTGVRLLPWRVRQESDTADAGDTRKGVGLCGPKGCSSSSFLCVPRCR